MPLGKVSRLLLSILFRTWFTSLGGREHTFTKFVKHSLCPHSMPTPQPRKYFANHLSFSRRSGELNCSLFIRFARSWSLVGSAARLASPLGLGCLEVPQYHTLETIGSHSTMKSFKTTAVDDDDFFEKSWNFWQIFISDTIASRLVVPFLPPKSLS